MIRCACPNCSRVSSHPDGMAGQPSRCQYCGQKFRVPLKVAGVVPDSRADESRQPPARSTPNEQETLVWSGRPSHLMNLGTYVLCAMLILAFLLTPWKWVAALFLPIPLWGWLGIHCKSYELTSQRFRVKQGVLSRRIDELELYRVKDTAFVQPFFLRIFSLANVIMVTSDMTARRTIIEAIPADTALNLREELRVNVEKLREQKRVREVDMR